MAMIKCRNCGAEISDKAERCVKCGFAVNEPRLICCKECGKVIDVTEEICPYCGCPNDKFKVSVTNKSNNIKKVICSILSVLCVFYGVFFAKYCYTDYQINEVRNNAIKVVDKNADLLIDVWHNSIWKQKDKATDKFTCPDGYFLEDFNDALDNFYDDKKINKDLEEINEVMNELISLRKGLRWAPIGRAEYNEQLIIMTDSFIDECEIILSPEGSLNEISEELSDLTDEGNKAVSRMERLL